MIELVEFIAPFTSIEGVELDENEEPILELRQGVILNWGTKPIETDFGVAQVTVVYVRESESGAVIELYPEEIKYL